MVSKSLYINVDHYSPSKVCKKLIIFIVYLMPTLGYGQLMAKQKKQSLKRMFMILIVLKQIMVSIFLCILATQYSIASTTCLCKKVEVGSFLAHNRVIYATSHETDENELEVAVNVIGLVQAHPSRILTE